MRFICVLVVVAIPLAAARAEEVARGPHEAIEAFAKRVLPPHTEPATRPVDLTLGPLGKAGVVLFVPMGDVANYTGWVFLPGANGGYKRVVLPPLETEAGIFDVEVKAVFAADADGDGIPELCVLSHYYRNGSGPDGDMWFETDVFRWDMTRFVLFEDAIEASLDLKNAKAVRAYFAKHPVKPLTKPSAPQLPAPQPAAPK
jgi:hypothetical protein